MIKYMNKDKLSYFIRLSVILEVVYILSYLFGILYFPVSYSFQPTAFSCCNFELASIYPISKNMKIVIKGIDNLAMYNRVFQLLSCNSKIYPNNHSDFIIFIISQLKLSGFFSQINSKILIDDKKYVVQIRVKVNPILKKIIINNGKNSLIPTSYIDILFKQQIGYPTSFSKISWALEEVTQWYYKRGYTWVTVSVISNSNTPHCLHLAISEGTVTVIDLVASSNKKYFFDITCYLSIRNILQTCELYVDNIINLQKLERGMYLLKTKNIFSKCYYKVTRQNSQKSFLKVTLFFETYNSKSIDSIVPSISDNVHFIGSLKTRLGILRTNYSYHRCLSILIQYLQTYIFCRTIELNPFYEELISKDRDLLLLDLLFYRKVSHFTNLYQNFSYFIFSFVVPQLSYLQPLSYKSYLQPFYKIKLYIKNGMPLVTLNYSNPYFIFLQDLFTNIKISCLHQIIYRQMEVLSILLNKRCHQINLYNSVLLGIQMYNLQCEHYIYNLHLTERLSIISIINKNFCIHKAFSWIYMQTFQHVYWTNEMAQLYYIWLNNMYHYFQVTYSYHHSIFYDNRIYMQSTYFVPYYSATFLQYLGWQYDFSQKLRFLLCNNQKQKLHYIMEYMTFLGSLYSLPSSERNFLMNPQIIRGYEHSMYPFLSQIIRLNIDYRIIHYSIHSFFVFCDTCLLRREMILNDLYLIPYNTFCLKLAYGIGWQIRTPFKNIPPINLEYGFNLNHEAYWHLRIIKCEYVNG